MGSSRLSWLAGHAQRFENELDRLLEATREGRWRLRSECRRRRVAFLSSERAWAAGMSSTSELLQCWEAALFVRSVLASCEFAREDGGINIYPVRSARLAIEPQNSHNSRRNESEETKVGKRQISSTHKSDTRKTSRNKKKSLHPCLSICIFLPSHRESN